MTTEMIEIPATLIGKSITALRLKDEILEFAFGDKLRFEISDDEQLCCERRYMHTDDDLPYYVGAKILSIEVRDVPNEPDEFEEHEVQFLIVNTSKGAFTVETHNEHNGYHGGFDIRTKIIKTGSANVDK